MNPEGRPLNDMSDEELENLVASVKANIESGSFPLLATGNELLDRLNKSHRRSA
jgi:hypothetical protein